MFIFYYLVQLFYILGFTYYLQSEFIINKYIIINLFSLLPVTYFWVNDQSYNPNAITFFNVFCWYIIADVYTFIFHYLCHTPIGMKYIHNIHHSVPAVKLQPIHGFNMHIIEFIFLEYGRILFGYIYFRPNKYIFLIISLINYTQNAINHYENKNNVNKWHIYHHIVKNKNYARITDIMIFRWIPDIFAYISIYFAKKLKLMFTKRFASYNKTDTVFLSTMCFNGYGHLTRSEEIIKVIDKKCILIIITKSSKLDQIKKITSTWPIPIEYVILDFDFNGSLHDNKNNYLYEIFSNVNEIRQILFNRYQDILCKYGIPKILITNQDIFSPDFILYEKHIAISSHFRLLYNNVYLSPLSRFYSKCNYLLHKNYNTKIIIPYEISNRKSIQSVETETNNLPDKYEMIGKRILIYWTIDVELLDLTKYNDVECKLITREQNISHFDFINELKKYDIFITSGGFESVIEALLLNKKVITFATQSNNQEQYWNSKLISCAYPNSIKHITSFNENFTFNNKSDYDQILADRNNYYYLLKKYTHE